MKIGLIAPPWIPVPPPAYGGTEAVVDNLARGLAALGHEVRLFTVGESTCPVRREHLYASAVTPIGQSVPEITHVLAAYEALSDVDIIHDHTIVGPLVSAALRSARVPVVTTNHGPFTASTRRIFAQISRTASVIAISADQARRAEEVPISAVIHHGIDLETYSPRGCRGDYLVFVGRMSPDKGVDRAVRIARAAGRPLRIISKMREPEERAYFEAVVRPLLSGEDELPEELPLAERIDILASAVALVNPICWPEPFGLVMAESLATATPVIAAPLGAAPEIVTHLWTGFLCPTEALATTAVLQVEQIERGRCRADAERRFSIERMARDHVALYERILTTGRIPSQQQAGWNPRPRISGRVVRDRTGAER